MNKALLSARPLSSVNLTIYQVMRRENRWLTPFWKRWTDAVFRFFKAKVSQECKYLTPPKILSQTSRTKLFLRQRRLLDPHSKSPTRLTARASHHHPWKRTLHLRRWAHWESRAVWLSRRTSSLHRRLDRVLRRVLRSKQDKRCLIRRQRAMSTCSDLLMKPPPSRVLLRGKWGSLSQQRVLKRTWLISQRLTRHLVCSQLLSSQRGLPLGSCLKWKLLTCLNQEKLANANSSTLLRWPQLNRKSSHMVSSSQDRTLATSFSSQTRQTKNRPLHLASMTHARHLLRLLAHCWLPFAQKICLLMHHHKKTQDRQLTLRTNISVGRLKTQ